ncbi:response regulator transcription factor [Candidatus Saccharibacteria bacterium]|nr:response regulator transcription factor [Candidatus Saccharibacteria bacterium]
MPNILLLEPNQLLGEQYSNYLRNLDYVVDWVKNAQEAVFQADKKKPDLVLMELLLAAHSGLEFLYEFRSYNEWQSVPIIILSRIPRAEFPVSDKILAEFGITKFLYKPETTLNDLSAKIARILPAKMQA